MKAEVAKQRYQLTLDREDQHYYYIMVLPRFPEEQADFQKARLVLAKQSFLPRELWFVQPNGDEVRWDIPRIDNGAKLNANDFTNPQVPPGWNMQAVPRARCSRKTTCRRALCGRMGERALPFPSPLAGEVLVPSPLAGEG